MASQITHHSHRGTARIRVVAAALLAAAGLVLAGCTAGSAGAPSSTGPSPSAASPSVPPVESFGPVASTTPCVSAAESSAACGSVPPASPSAPAAPVSPPVAPSSAPVASPGPPTAPHGTQAPASGTTVITLAQNGTTLHLTVGEQVELKLGTDNTWAPRIADPSIVAPVSGASLAPGVQGVYVARSPGTTTLTAVGSPSCAPGSICPQFRVLFTLKIAVS